MILAETFPIIYMFTMMMYPMIIHPSPFDDYMELLQIIFTFEGAAHIFLCAVVIFLFLEGFFRMLTWGYLFVTAIVEAEKENKKHR